MATADAGPETALIAARALGDVADFMARAEDGVFVRRDALDGEALLD